MSAPHVRAVEPRVKSIVEWDEYRGRFSAVERVEVRSRVSGYLDALLFEEGSLVSRGDPIAIIDRRPFRIALESAIAAVSEAQSAYDLAQVELTRAERLRETPAFSQDLFDERAAQERAAAARLAGAEAEKARVQLDLEFASVTAPISGRIGRRLVTEGNLITGGQAGTLLTTIVSVDPIYFDFSVSEADYLRYNRLNASGARPTSRDTDNPVELKLSDEDTFEHKGRMDFVDNELARGTATLDGRAVFPNPEGFFQPGQFGTIRLAGSAEYEAVMVPDAAVLSDQSRKFVFVIGEGDAVERRWVTPGPIVDGLRVLRDGVAPGEAVIIGGLQRVRPGVVPQVEMVEIADLADTAN